MTSELLTSQECTLVDRVVQVVDVGEEEGDQGAGLFMRRKIGLGGPLKL